MAQLLSGVFYPTKSSQCAIDQALSIANATIRPLHASLRLEPESAEFVFYGELTALAVPRKGRPAEISGLAVFRQPAVRRRLERRRNKPGLKPYSKMGIPVIARLEPPGAGPAPARFLTPLLLDCFDNALHFGREGKTVALTASGCW